MEKYRQQIASFSRIWAGGYFEGDPLDPFHPSTYLGHGYLSVLHVAYLACIRPYVSSETTVLEIGPGRGAWTKTFLSLGAKEVWALDAASAEHTRFHQHVGRHPHVRYVQVDDCSLSDVPDDSIDYFFTFGVFCHLPPAMVADYVSNLRAKMRTGSNGFMMIGDFEKYNECARTPDALERLFSLKVFLIHRWVDRLARRLRPQYFSMRELDSSAGVAEQGQGELGAWYHLGTDEACALLEAAGFEIVTPDVGVNPRDPIVQFRVP